MNVLKHVFRRFGMAPTFTAIALITLALGIGANTAIFSVINGVLIKPLPFPQSGSLVGVWHTAPGIPAIGGNINCSPTMYFTYRQENQTFQEFGLWSNGGATVTGVGDPEQPTACWSRTVPCKRWVCSRRWDGGFRKPTIRPAHPIP